MLAQRRGLRIHEVPVDWVDDPDSRVDIVQHRAHRPAGASRGCSAAGPIAKFMGIGVLSTLAYALLYVALHPLLGAVGANAAALAITAVGQHRGQPPPDVRRARARGRSSATTCAARVVFVLTLALTNGALAVLHGLDPHPARALELARAGRRVADRDDHALRRDAHVGVRRTSAAPSAPRSTWSSR